MSRICVRTSHSLAGDLAMKDAVEFLVIAESPEKAVRVNIIARESQIEAIDKLARKAGMTRSAYMVQPSVRVVRMPTSQNRDVGHPAPGW